MTRTLVFMLAAPLVFGACQDYRNLGPYEGTTCSGHGTYSENNGEAECTCDEGYGGDLCAECGEGYHDEDGACVLSEVCEAGSCSGHGTCDDSNGVVACTCDDGHEGDQCESCVPGYQDNDGDGFCLTDCASSGLDCGSHGKCDDSGGTAICSCDEGYTGEQCAECASGYHDEGGVCVGDQECLENTCSGHGACDDSTGVPTCTCEMDHSGDHCESCSPGYQDNDRDGTCSADCTTSGLDCGNHGTCDDSDGTAVCACDVGYLGVACDTCVDGFQDNDDNGSCFPDCATSGLDCGDHGACDDSGGTAVCVCDVGYVGAACEACAASFQDNDGDGSCLPDCSAQDCSGHGTCDDSSGSTLCLCDQGYTGASCDTCDAGYQDHDGNGSCLPDCATSGLDCGSHGTCDDSYGAAVCVCDVGYTGAMCDTCDAGYQDNDGDGSCLPDCATSGLDCGTHGACDDSGGTAVCACDVGYVGALCDTCDVGYQDNNGDGTCLTDCSTQDCSGHGTCDDISGMAVCTCDNGWGGPECSVDLVDFEWVVIPGGTFMMGSDSRLTNEQPVHLVSVPSFEMTETEVTLRQYRACVNAGVCSDPVNYHYPPYCNWDYAGREDHPVNCVDWFQAVDFCTWVGGRLPSEAEWEYAARGGGQDITYPWGDDPASCTYAVMDDGGDGCGMDRTWEVCSKPAGSTAHGLCDMAGNVDEWVQDWYHGSYDCDANPGAVDCWYGGGIAPSDGSAWDTPSASQRVARSGNFINDANVMRVSFRIHAIPWANSSGMGIRCAR